MNSQQELRLLDESIVATLDESPFALSITELSTALKQRESVLLEALNRLGSAGRVKMTADRAKRVYYTRYEHLM